MTAPPSHRLRQVNIFFYRQSWQRQRLHPVYIILVCLHRASARGRRSTHEIGFQQRCQAAMQVEQGNAHVIANYAVAPRRLLQDGNAHERCHGRLVARGRLASRSSRRCSLSHDVLVSLCLVSLCLVSGRLLHTLWTGFGFRLHETNAFIYYSPLPKFVFVVKIQDP